MKRLLIITVLLLSTSITFAAKKSPQAMFIVFAKISTIQANKDDNYTLSINLKDLNEITAYSERPHRKIETISDKRLLSDWKKGTNSLQKNPPNAVLSADNFDPTVFMITQVKVQDKKMIYQLKLIHGEEKIHGSQQLQDAVLVIDSLSMCKVFGGATACTMSQKCRGRATTEQEALWKRENCEPIV